VPAQRSWKDLLSVPLAWAATACLAVRSRLVHFVLARPEILRKSGGFRAVAWSLRSAPKEFIPGILRAYGAEVAEPVTLHPPLHIHGARESADGRRDGFRNLRIGKNVHIGPDSFLDLTGSLTIEDDVGISMRGTIITHYFPAMTYYFHERPQASVGVTIGKGVHVTAGVTILDGVTIGEGALILPGAVVTSSIPAWTMAGGVPARPMRRKAPWEAGPGAVIAELARSARSEPGS
jgi:acetyltransferase-like isoleucine patch superfamily enzyme